MIARNPSLTDQVKANLKERIVNGEFDEGRMPSESDLAVELGVSRTTVRGALSQLENEGTIYRRQGAGTFVNEPGLQIKSRLEEMWSYEEVLRDHGYTPSVEVLRVAEEQASDVVANDLALAVGDPVLSMEKLFLEDDEPVVLTHNRVPSNDLPEDAATFVGDEALPEFLDRHSDRHLAYYVSELVPVALDSHQAKCLGVAENTPAICVQEIGFDQDNEPLVRSTSYFRDDLLRFRLIRRKPGA